MTKRIAMFLVFVAMMAFSVAAAAQTGSIKGVCKDETGKPYVGASVELDNLENGRKITLKTDSHGNYYTMGLTSGRYKITLSGPDGKMIYYFNNVPLTLGENAQDFDMAKEREAAVKASGVSEEQRKEIEKAKKDADKIKGLNALLVKASEQKKANDFEGAVATMEQAVALDQTHDIIYGSLADSYLGAKRYPDAETAYKKAIELAKPDSKAIGNYHNGLAQALLKQGQTAPAMAEYDTAAQVDPANAGMYFFNEGAVLTNQGKVDEANQAFDKAIAADPNRAEAYYQKGVNLLGKATLGKDGKMVPAPGTTEALNKYLELSPDGRNAQTAKDLLTTLGASVQTTFGQKKGSKK